MIDKKYWAEKFQQALQNKDSLERYAVCTNWWNDFKSQIMIVQEVYDFEMEGGEIQLLSSENKFDNSKLILFKNQQYKSQINNKLKCRKEGDYEERTLLFNKMKELQKDSIKTMQDYFTVNHSMIVNKDFSLIGGEAYNMLLQLTNGGPSIRLFIDEIKGDSELNDKVITGFMEGNDSLNENQFIDLDTIQLGILIKYQDQTIIEVGYYPKNKSLSHILKVITQKMNIDYTCMAIDLRKYLTNKQIQNSFDDDKKILNDGLDENFFYFNKKNETDERQNKTLNQISMKKNQIIIFTDEYSPIQKNEEQIWFDQGDMMNFTEGGFNLLYNPAQQQQQGNQNKTSVQKSAISEPQANRFRKTPMTNNRVINLNTLNSENNACERGGSNATLESTYDSPTQIHNNSVNNNNGSDNEADDEDEDLNNGRRKFRQNNNQKRNILKRNKNSDDSTEENDPDEDNQNQETENQAPFSLEKPTIPRQIIGFAKSQEEIDQIKDEIRNSIRKGGSLIMHRLPNQIIAQNISQMINQMTQTIHEQLYQRAKQENTVLQSQSLDKLRQLRDLSTNKGDDSDRTSTTSTQSENIKKKKRKTKSNILFDEPNIIDMEENSLLVN